MGVYHNVYIGPYAEYLIRAGDPIPSVEDVAKGKLLDKWGLGRGWGLDDPPTVEVDGISFQSCCYVPGCRRQGAPDRQTDYSDCGEGAGIQDLRVVDVEAEIAWLGSAFRKELRTLE
jgi:hypothetical protein